MILIYLSVYVLVINLKMFIRAFGPVLLNMNLLTSLYKLSLLKGLKSKILMLFLVIYINLFLTLVMENLDKNPVKPKLNLQLKKKWKMKICLLMMFLSVLNQEMDKFAIKLKCNNKRDQSCLLITSLVIFFHILNK